MSKIEPLGSLQAGAPHYEASDEARAVWAATKTMPEPLTFISLFAGIGGID